MSGAGADPGWCPSSACAIADTSASDSPAGGGGGEGSAEAWAASSRGSAVPPSSSLDTYAGGPAASAIAKIQY